MILSFTQRDQSRTATAIERTLIIKPTDTIRFHASHLRHGDLEGLPGIGNPGGEKQGKFTASAQCYFGNGDTQGVGGLDQTPWVTSAVLYSSVQLVLLLGPCVVGEPKTSRAFSSKSRLI